MTALDAALAKALGWEPSETRTHAMATGEQPEEQRPPAYSSSWGEMGRLVVAMMTRGHQAFRLSYEESGEDWRWFACFGSGNWVYADTAPLAVAKAAAKALGLMIE